MIYDSDLACERQRANTSLPGVQLEAWEKGLLKTERVRVESEAGARSIGKPRGTYVTLSFPPPWEMPPKEEEALTEAVAQTLWQFLQNRARDGILVLGLGNRNLTADAIGCRTANGVHATRHLEREEPSLFRALACRKVTVLTPGVLAQTGMEAAMLAKAAVAEARPSLVLAVDALAARSKERLFRTVQFADSGIVPGSGIGSCRHAINEDFLGVPVIAVGVPTVVDAWVLVRDALGATEREELPPAVEAAIAERGAFFVSPKECDAGVEVLSRVLATAINRAAGILPLPQPPDGMHGERKGAQRKMDK